MERSRTPADDRVEQFYASDEKPSWRVSAEYLRREQVLVNFSTHAAVIDHAVGLGGDDMGPSPGEMLLAALSACTAVYLGRAVVQRGIPATSVTVRARFRAAHEPGTEVLPRISFLDRIEKRVEVAGELTEQQLAELRYISEHCAIGETLRRGVDVHEELVNVDEADATACRIGSDGSSSCCAAPA